MAFESRRGVVTSCRAVLLQRFGGPEVLEVRENVNLPQLKPNEVLVRTRAVSVNPFHTRLRSCSFAKFCTLAQCRAGSFWCSSSYSRGATYSDYAILAEDELTIKPESISHVEASAIPFAALTAWRALRCTARIKQGIMKHQ